MPIHDNKRGDGMVAPVQNAAVIAWVIDQFEAAEADALPPGWRHVECLWGPFDGLKAVAPVELRQNQLVIVLPTTPSNRPGGACYAAYILFRGDDEASFVGIETSTTKP